MKYLPGCFVLLMCGLILPSCMSQKESPYPATGSVERLDPGMDRIISPGTLPEIIADSFIWSEGPLWIPELDILVFSDIPQNIVFQWTEKDGLKPYLTPSGYTDTLPRGGETGSNGLILDAGGSLVLCQHGDRRMARMDAPVDRPEPRFVTIAAHWQGKRFNSPNDAVFSSSGDLYFTDPAYGMEFRWEDPGREIDFAGVYRVSPQGEVHLLIDSIPAPNGIGLSPDETKLYVASSGNDACWYEYALTENKTLADGRVFSDAKQLQKSRHGSPDGLAVRGDGILFASGPGGVLVFDPQGKHLGTILTGQATSNCTLDEKGSWLYITADMYVMRIRLKPNGG